VSDSNAKTERKNMSSRVKPIPSGMHTLTPHLVVKGASKAIDFYKKAFGAQEVARLAAPDGKSLYHALTSNTVSYGSNYDNSHRRFSR